MGEAEVKMVELKNITDTGALHIHSLKNWFAKLKVNEYKEIENSKLRAAGFKASCLKDPLRVVDVLNEANRNRQAGGFLVYFVAKRE